MAIVNHRQIYEHCYGPIPIDKDGRSYDIDHLDGNHANNHPANLDAKPIKKHYEKHYELGEYGAAWAIAMRMKMSPTEFSEIARQNALKRSAAGTLPAQIKGKNGTHHFTSEFAYQRVKNGTHPFLSGELQRKNNRERLENGTHNFIKMAATVHTCPKCGKIGKGSPMFRWHFDNCKII